MDSQELRDILEHNVVTSNSFHGVYARDTLPPLTVPGSFIVNTEVKSEPGEHWCTIWRNTEEESRALQWEIEFWDSLGKPPSEYGFRFSVGVGDAPLRIV